MCRRMMATLVALLAGTGIALGQPAATPPPLETLPYPAPFATPIDVVTAAPVSGAAFPDVGPPAGWVLRADADAVLWFSPVHRSPTFIDAPNLMGTVVPGGGSDTVSDENIARHMIPGARVALGYWWMEENAWTPGRRLPMAGFETRFMFVGQRTVSLTDNSSATLVRPFFDLNDAIPSALIVAAPGLAAGGITTRAAESIWGAEANYWRNLYYEWPGTTCSVDGMIGFRFLNLDDSVQVQSDSQFLSKIAPAFLPAFASFAGNHLTVFDSFAAHNRFYGGQIGVRGNLIFDHFIVSGQFQLGMGDTNEELTVQGAQTRTLATGQSIQSQGGLLALPGNIGRHNHNEFTLLPEFGATVTIPVNDNIAFGVTFTTIYWSRIIRAADQLDTALDIRQIPNFPGAAAAGPAASAHPSVPFGQSDLWLMGAMLTAQFRW